MRKKQTENWMKASERKQRLECLFDYLCRRSYWCVPRSLGMLRLRRRKKIPNNGKFYIVFDFPGAENTSHRSCKQSALAMSRNWGIEEEEMEAQGGEGEMYCFQIKLSQGRNWERCRGMDNLLIMRAECDVFDWTLRDDPTESVSYVPGKEFQKICLMGFVDVSNGVWTCFSSIQQQAESEQVSKINFECQGNFCHAKLFKSFNHVNVETSKSTAKPRSKVFFSWVSSIQTRLRREVNQFFIPSVSTRLTLKRFATSVPMVSFPFIRTVNLSLMSY